MIDRLLLCQVCKPIRHTSSQPKLQHEQKRIQQQQQTKTRPIEDADRRVSACLRCHCPALIATLLHLVTARDFPIPPLDFPHFRIYTSILCVLTIGLSYANFAANLREENTSVCMAARKLE